MPIVIIGLSGDLSHISSWRVLDAISDIGIIIAMVGLFSYGFKTPILSRGFWGTFFVLYLLENIYELTIRIVPQSTYRIPSFMVGYNTKLNTRQPNYETLIILLLVEIPILYSLLQLAIRKTK